MVRYYQVRKPGKGGIIYPSYTRSGLDNVVNFDRKIYCVEIGRPAYGFVEHCYDITEKEAKLYGLMYGGNEGKAILTSDGDGYICVVKPTEEEAGKKESPPEDNRFEAIKIGDLVNHERVNEAVASNSVLASIAISGFLDRGFDLTQLLVDISIRQKGNFEVIWMTDDEKSRNDPRIRDAIRKAEKTLKQFWIDANNPVFYVVVHQLHKVIQSTRVFRDRDYAREVVMGEAKVLAEGYKAKGWKPVIEEMGEYITLSMGGYSSDTWKISPSFLQ